MGKWPFRHILVVVFIDSTTVNVLLQNLLRQYGRIIQQSQPNKRKVQWIIFSRREQFSSFLFLSYELDLQLGEYEVRDGV